MKSATASFLSAIALLATTAAAEQTLTLSLQDDGPKEQQPVFVETSDVIVIDVSSSMDDHEIIAAFHGAADYYLSDRNLSNYKMGVCAQSTVIFFAKDTYIGNSAVICSEADAIRFANNLMSQDITNLKTMLHSGFTNTHKGLSAARDFFQAQASEGRVRPLQHRVVLIGDELQFGSVAPMRREKPKLVAEFDTQIFAIAIGSEDVKGLFDQYVVSDNKIFPSALALSADGVSYNLNHFLRHTMG